jgi:asparagine synthase (glutamine-hydrolysing)
MRLLEHLKPVKPRADRAFLAHCLADLSYSLGTLLHRHDRMGMAASMEMRVPFLENSLLDFAFHLPRRAKLQGTVGKWIVKQAAAAELPREIVFARKKAFPTPASFVRGTEQLLLGGLVAEYLGWSQGPLRDLLPTLDGHETVRFHLVSAELWLRIMAGGCIEELGERLVALAR